MVGGDPLEEVIDVDAVGGDEAQRGRQLELSLRLSLVPGDVPDRLHDAPAPHAVHPPGHDLVRPDRLGVDAPGGVPERQDDERLAVAPGPALGPVHHAQLVLHALSDGEP
jgi:hypothetical protein